MLRVCWRKLAVREPSRRDWGVRCEICVMFDVFKVLNLPDICYCMCCTPPPPPTILECQSACLYPINKSDFLSEICSVSFKNK